MSAARAQLKAALAEIDKLANQVAELKTAQQAAENAVEEAQAELDSFDGLDAEITKFRVSATKRGANPRKLPDELKAKVDAKRAAEDESGQANTTLETLVKELAAAESKLKARKGEQTKFAVAVVQEFADAIAEELLDLQCRRAVGLALLNGLAEVSVMVDGQNKFVGFSNKAIEAIAERTAEGLPGGIPHRAAMAKRWATRIDALLKDPDAKITVPKLVQASDILFDSNPAASFLGVLRPFILRPEE